MIATKVPLEHVFLYLQLVSSDSKAELDSDSPVPTLAWPKGATGKQALKRIKEAGLEDKHILEFDSVEGAIGCFEDVSLSE
jgi:hypothetical protein